MVCRWWQRKEERAESKEERAKSKEQRAESKEQRAKVSIVEPVFIVSSFEC
jgi:hypothetical protein